MSIGIYKFQNNITNEVYIGQSVELEARYIRHKRDWLNGTTDFYQAIQQYGWDCFSYEVIEYCDISELNEREQYWIKYYDSYYNGYNMNKGGSRPNSINHNLIYELFDNNYTPKQIADKMGIGLSTVYQSLNCYAPYLKQHNINSNVIYQYDLQGKFIDEWNSCKEAGRILNIDSASIGKVLDGQRNSAGGFLWSKEKAISIDPIRKTSIPKVIYQYDLNKNFIKSFNSIAEAAKEVCGDSSAIRRAASQGLSHSAYGFRWSFVI